MKSRNRKLGKRKELNSVKYSHALNHIVSRMKATTGKDYI